MGTTYSEYVRGKWIYYPIIASLPVYLEHIKVKSDVFYPTVPISDTQEDDAISIADIISLKTEKVKVCEKPDSEPVEKELYVIGDWGFEIIAEDGETDEPKRNNL